MSNSMRDLIDGEAELDDEEDDESFDGEGGSTSKRPPQLDDSSEEEDDDDEEEAQRVRNRTPLLAVYVAQADNILLI